MDANLKIVTVTLNPALDLTGSLSQLKLGNVNLIDKSALSTGGKGINVAKVLADLGAEVTVTGFIGSDNQAPFVQLFNSNNITDKFVRVSGSTRTNVKLVEQSGQVSDINFPGIKIAKNEIKQFQQILFSLAESHDIFVVAGSLPQGVSTTQLKNWIQQLQQKGKKVFFDSSNQALIEGIQAVPYLIKPNDHELNTIAGKKLITTEAITQTAEKLYTQGCSNVVVSLGDKGVLWLDQTGWIKSIPQKVNVVSTVGAGDTLVAGLCWAELNQWDKKESLTFATALAALAVSQINVGVKDLNKVTEMQKYIQITTRLFNNK